MTDALRELRPEDQDYPAPNDLPSMHEKAQADMESRKQLGIKRYGVALQPANGRDAIRDAYEEALDGAAYGAQAVWEQENPEKTYVGWLIRALANSSAAPVIFYPRGMFIPDGVRDYMDDQLLQLVEEDA